MAEKLNDCVLKTINQCTVDIVWQYSIGKTEIVVTSGCTKKSISTNHVLNVAIGYEYRDELVAKKVLEYKCSTDECNSFDQIKRLINSLTVIHHLDEMTNMIKPQEPFQGAWSDRVSNTTTNKCNIIIPNDACRRCLLAKQIDEKTTQGCTPWLTETLDNSLSYTVMFNMTDRTRSNIWQVLYQAESCNSLSNADLIREKNAINFDFNKFFNNGQTDYHYQ
ncbi:unnamed protein product [Adineta steineri]|uniref:Uncharacterized protein n=1 Tax=Adineta steineri TaxID=433720 RepID=A0A815IKT8_9BILA|nr:unnamed protein product [Adineta steineri]CAF1487927.1 unnamed protein product [Adineta steineri]CAF1602791.1 unnamed protein product [Adineta steineri]CAF1640609.1 unnamed protein product [Adineta steineri]